MNLADRFRGLEDPLRTERRVELVLIVLAALLVLQLLWGGVRAMFPSMPEPVQPRPNSLKVLKLNSSEPIDPELRGEISARPLFWAERRPPQAKSAAEAVAEAKQEENSKPKSGKIDGVKLTGVFGSGESAGIIVLSKGKKHRVRVGEEINGWKLQSVGESEAVFSAGGRESRLALKQGTIQVATQEETAAAPAAAPGDSGGSGKKPRKAKTQPVAKSNNSDSLTLGGRAPVER